MVDPSVVVAAVGGTAMCGAYVYGVWYVLMHWHKYRPFPYELLVMNINAIVGMASYTLYALNVGAFGLPLRTVDSVFDGDGGGCSTCVGNVDRARRLLYAYLYLSIARFCVWYSEALVSLRFLAVYPARACFFIVLRYAVHTLNFVLSIGALVVVAQPEFPMYELLLMRDDRKTHPITVQLVVAVLVLVGYGAIAGSRPYALPSVCMWSRRSWLTAEW